jgi:hypothetical protein
MKNGLLILFLLLGNHLVFAQNGHFYIPFKQGDLWSVADEKGDILFNPKYEETFPSTFSLIRFRHGEKFGFINPKGDVIIKPIYDKATDYYYFGEKPHSYVTLGDSTFYIDLNGQHISPIFGCDGSYSNMPNGLSVFKVNGKFGLMSMHGDTLSKPIFNQIINYNDGSFVVAQNVEMQFGLIDWKGDIIFPFTLDSVKYDHYNFRYTFYRIYEGKLCGIVDIDGRVQIQPKYESLEFYPHFKKGLCFKAKKGDEILGYVYEGKEYWKK